MFFGGDHFWDTAFVRQAPTDTLKSRGPGQARLATNCVTMGDLGRPPRIARFTAELFDGFRALTLKNDALRRRFDGLKYDAKKIEGVVYDLKIRNLVPPATAAAAEGEPGPGADLMPADAAPAAKEARTQ